MSEQHSGGASPAGGAPADADAVAERPERTHDYSQFGLAALLAVLAVVILVNTAGLRTDFADIDPIGPTVFPRIVAVGLIVTAVLLAIATARGSVPEAEEGEDVDLSQRPDWRTVALLVLTMVFLIATVDLLGWTISSAVFFTACAAVLGSRTFVRDLIVGVVLGLGSFYFFYSVLGVLLPAGILDGIL